MMEMKVSDISAIQYSELRKALGLNNNQKRPNKKSHYAFGPSDLWEDLAEKGFAIKQPGQRTGEACYVVTFEAVKLVYRKHISLDYYLRL
ncbi:hypothetical protein [Cytobacillus firmus]|jgi:hypothetical protein|uniref:hypothetical protein n=1 Tax=Cytobacillus firmus TaxID=1399 RepID=UPI0018CD427C|nr:hypothetical protein [Cytobacillus firmus]